MFKLIFGRETADPSDEAKTQKKLLSTMSVHKPLLEPVAKVTGMLTFRYVGGIISIDGPIEASVPLMRSMWG